MHSIQVEGIGDGIPSTSQQSMAGCLADKGCDSDTDEARLPHSPQSKANTDGHDNKKQATIPGLSLSQFVPPPQPSQSEQPLAVESKEEEEEEEEEHTLSWEMRRQKSATCLVSPQKERASLPRAPGRPAKLKMRLHCQ